MSSKKNSVSRKILRKRQSIVDKTNAVGYADKEKITKKFNRLRTFQLLRRGNLNNDEVYSCPLSIGPVSSGVAQ